MTKIKHTRNHTIQVVKTIDGMFPHTGWDDILVTDGEVMLINPNQDVINTLTSHGRLATEFKEHSIETGKNSVGVDLWWKRSETKLLGVPIVISRTEKIEKGDWTLANGKLEQVLQMQLGEDDIWQYKTNTAWFSNCVKVLALPENFSPEQLKQLANGEVKTGKCVVECELLATNRDGGTQVHQIKLNPHITLYPVVEKMYTKNQLREAYEAGSDLVNHNWHMEEFHGTNCKCVTPSYNDFDQWFEQNVL